MSDRNQLGVIREGSGSAKGIGKEEGKYVIVLADLSWEDCQDFIGGEPEDIVQVRNLEEYWLEEQLDQIPPCDKIIGLGSKMALEAAKYLAWKKELPLITIPRTLDTDAFIQPEIDIFQNYQPFRIGEISPDILVLDYDMMRSVPEDFNIAGVANLLAVHTACFDWEHAKAQGKAGMSYSHKAVDDARKMLDDLTIFLSDIGQNNNKGLRALAEGYIQLQNACYEFETTRVKIGSAHYFKQELSERLQKEFEGGGVLALGIFLMARLQNNKPDEVISWMDEVGLDFQPMHLDLSPGILSSSLLDLNYYVQRKPGLFYTCLNDANMDEEWVYEMIQGLVF